MNGFFYKCRSEVSQMAEVQSVSNLKGLARKANLSGVQIAELMGFRPETVSRHLNGKQTISIEDAIKYAKILSCSAEEILFKRSLCPIIGEMDGEGDLHLFGEDENKKIYLAGPYSFHEDHIAYTIPKWFNRKTTAICILNKKPMDGNYVSENGIGHISLCKTTATNTQKSEIFVGYPFENSDMETYTVRRLKNLTNSQLGKSGPMNMTVLDKSDVKYSKVHLDWVCPTELALYRPDLSGFEIVKDH